MKKTISAVLLIFLTLPQLAFGWGQEGHRIIATVAEDHLDQTTLVMIQSLIGNNHLYSVATWADDIRNDRRETAGWHYVDIPLGSSYVAGRDCIPPKSCVIEKIADYTKVLADKSASREERAEALKFLVHFVGDVHQPLHAVGDARGGNGIRVRFLGDEYCGRYECNLHGVWDTSMIQHTGLNQQEYSQRLEAAFDQAVEWADRIDASGTSASPNGGNGPGGDGSHPSDEYSTPTPNRDNSRSSRPMIPQRSSITEYTSKELVRLISWVASDGEL